MSAFAYTSQHSSIFLHSLYLLWHWQLWTNDDNANNHEEDVDDDMNGDYYDNDNDDKEDGGYNENDSDNDKENYYDDDELMTLENLRNFSMLSLS